MFLDTRDLPDRSTVEADLCIVGAGAAGIALAMELLDTPTRVVLLEGGGRSEEPGGRPLYEVVSDTHPWLGLHRSRAWYFGGATNHWHGNCRPLEDTDFERRDWVPYSGWPIRRHDLQPYYVRAQAMCGLGPFHRYDLEACRAQLRHQPYDVDPAILASRIVQSCPVPSFARLHGDRLAAADNVRIVLHAQATQFTTNSAGDHVDAVEASGPVGRRIRVRATAFVLAAGGVENARLLLCSNDVMPQGLGNGHDVVGRYFMEHWCVDIPVGRWAHTRDLRFHADLQPVGDSRVWAQFAVADELQRRERVPGLGLWLQPRPAVPAVSRVLQLLKRPLTEIELGWRNPGQATGPPPNVGRHLAKGRQSPRQSFQVTVQPEQTPDPENRLRLSTRRTRHGQPGVDLVLRFTDAERRAHRISLELAAAALGLDGARLVRHMDLRLEAGLFSFIWHHTGTTRMHHDPAQGVVDADCRVHGVANLFIAGSSVFPTSGVAAPTLTIVALAIRLADHLRFGRRLPVAGSATSSNDAHVQADHVNGESTP